ncbi:MAG: tellurite resistance TerB family protein [Candidatus Contendobacter sp.]|nr:tellurite resistance TerB family protein [Candidatus Contendobacter sp.]
MDPLKLLGSLLGNNATSSGQGGQILGQLLGSLTGGGAQSGGAGGGGLADLLGGLTRGGAQGGGAGGGGLADLLGGLTRGGVQSGAAGGGLADLLGGLTGAVRPQGGATPGGSNMGSLLGSLAMVALQMFGQRGAASGQSAFAAPAGAAAGQASPTMDATQTYQQALAFIKAMINAAKADGQIDAEEQEKIVSRLGDIGPQEAEFIREEMSKPLNFDFFADITQDLTPQIYAVSLMAINLDTPAETSYMQQLAQGLGLDPQTVNGIHAKLGLAPLYG